jgi:uncharacterized membrane protein
LVVAFGLTTAGTIHACLAMAGILIGLLQFLLAKGTRAHRALGYAYVYGMVAADGAALLVYQFTGRFNILHVGAIANLLCIVAAIVPVLRSPRPLDWKALHYRWISWSYVGLLAAASTELVVRNSHLATKGQAWIATALVSGLVTATGAGLIRRYWPASGPGLGDANNRA